MSRRRKLPLEDRHQLQMASMVLDGMVREIRRAVHAGEMTPAKAASMAGLLEKVTNEWIDGVLAAHDPRWRDAVAARREVEWTP